MIKRPRYAVPTRAIWVIFLIVTCLSLAGCGGGASTATPAEDSPMQTGEVEITLPPMPTPSAIPPAQPAEQDADTPAEQEAALAPSLDCSSPAALTPPMAAGPFYKPDAPVRTSLIEAGMGGTGLVLSGYVLTADCEPIPNALLDFWQADDQGAYDNAGYRLRGRQYSDEMGRYRLETIVPGLYPGRTAHIHVKVQAPDGPVLTTQLFFPDEPANQGDFIFSPQLLVDIQDTPDGKLASFDFVVETR